jgi:hypothetical protein
MGSIRCTLRCLLLLLLIASISSTAASQAVLFTGVYHEAGCPSVDTTRMVRMKRHTAEAKGLLPAIDCHPDARVRYLGVGPSGPSPSSIDEASRPRTIDVSGYTRKDGTKVGEHFRAAPRARPHEYRTPE